MIDFLKHIFSPANCVGFLLITMQTASLPAMAAQGPATYAFALQAGDLDAALKQVSRRTGVSLLYDFRLVAGRNAPPLSGHLSAQDAVTALLRDSPLELRDIDGRAMAIVLRQPVAPHRTEEPPVIIAQAPSANTIDEIIVSASYRVPSSLGGLSADHIIDDEAFRLSGAQNISEPIHELPVSVASVSSANTQLLSSSSGLNLTDLRGLGPARSLVLVNGRRIVRTNGGNDGVYGVDLNSIPTEFIDRVEIINQGAGPMLGTEAVAGVVNIVLREQIDGLSVSAFGGVSEHGDAGEYSFSIFAGTPWASDRGNFSIGAVYASDAALFFSDRNYLSAPYGFGLNGRVVGPEDGGEFLRGFGGSTFTPAGSVQGAIDENGEVHFFDTGETLALLPNGFEAFENRLDQTYNWIEGFSAYPELERFHAYSHADFELAPNLKVSGEILFANIDVMSQIAAAPVSAFQGRNLLIGDSVPTPSDHPLAPPGLRTAVENIVGAPVDTFLVRRRFTELGPRIQDINRKTIQISADAKLDLGHNWVFAAEYQYGQATTRQAALGAPDGNRVLTSADPLLCAAIPGCTPLNVFDGGNVPENVAAYYALDRVDRRIETVEQAARVIVEGPFNALGNREGNISFGGEFRRNSLDDMGPGNDINALGFFRIDDARGAINYGEIFFGADLPLTDEESRWGTIDVGIDARFTRWTGDHSVINFSGRLAWKPTPGLELYAHALNGGRAPNAPEILARNQSIAFYFRDPCYAPSSPVVVENCASDGPLGVPDGFAPREGLVNWMSFPNAALEREKVHTRHFGLAANLHELFSIDDAQLSLTTDWRRHRISNGITAAGAIVPLFVCYESDALSNPFCGINPATGNLFIQREETTGQLELLEQSYVNGAQVLTSGLDTNLSYQTDFTLRSSPATFSIDLLYSFLNKAEFLEVTSLFPEDRVGLSEYPRHQIYATTSIETEQFKTYWTVRRRGRVQTVLGIDNEAAILPATTYVDAGFQFRPKPSIILYAGVENLMDKKLPVAAFSQRGFLAEFYDPIGRRYFAGVKAEF